MGGLALPTSMGNRGKAKPATGSGAGRLNGDPSGHDSLLAATPRKGLTLWKTDRWTTGPRAGACACRQSCRTLHTGCKHQAVGLPARPSPAGGRPRRAGPGGRQHPAEQSSPTATSPPEGARSSGWPAPPEGKVQMLDQVRPHLDASTTPGPNGPRAYCARPCNTSDEPLSNWERPNCPVFDFTVAAVQIGERPPAKPLGTPTAREKPSGRTSPSQGRPRKGPVSRTKPRGVPAARAAPCGRHPESPPIAPQ